MFALMFVMEHPFSYSLADWPLCRLAMDVCHSLGLTHSDAPTFGLALGDCQAFDLALDDCQAFVLALDDWQA